MTTVMGIDDLTAEYEAAYRRKTPTSAELFARAATAMPGGDTRQSVYFQPYPLYVQSGKGSRVTDVDGNVLIDFGNCWTAMVLGHAPESVVKAIVEQAERGTAFAAANPYVQELAQLVVERVPSVEKVRFCNSGSEATMMCVRAARAFTGKNKVLKFDGGYHGSTDIFEVEMDHVVPGITQGVADDVLIAKYNDLDEVRDLVTRYKDELACVIVEGLMGAAGMIPPAEGFLEGLREVTREHDVLLIFDEVISLRLASGGAQEHYGVLPDLTAMGKIIGGGLPVGAFGGREDVMMQFSPLREGHMHHSGTYNGNPVTMAAGIATLKELTQERIDAINALGERARVGLRAAVKRAGLKAEIVGIGSLMQLHFTDRPVTRARAGSTDPVLLHLLHLGLFQEGVFANERGAYNITTAHTAEDVDVLVAAVERVLTAMRPAIQQRRPDLVA